jgi:hypothetical protein
LYNAACAKELEKAPLNARVPVFNCSLANGLSISLVFVKPEYVVHNGHWQTSSRYRLNFVDKVVILMLPIAIPQALLD